MDVRFLLGRLQHALPRECLRGDGPQPLLPGRFGAGKDTFGLRNFPDTDRLML